MSDHSAVNHYTQVVVLALKKIVEESDLDHTGVSIRQLDVLQRAILTSAHIAYTCAGHESLWYLRRLVVTITCRCVLMWMRGKGCAHTLATDGVESARPEDRLESVMDVLNDTQHAHLMRCLSATEGGRGASESSGDHSLEEGDMSEENSDVTGGAVQRHLASMRELCSQLERIIHSSLLVESFCSWLRNWVQVEVEFYMGCVEDNMSWNPELQRVHGGSFLRHLLQTVCL